MTLHPRWNVSTALNELSPAEIEDILRGLLGKQLGAGVARAVFPLKTDPKRVAKLELMTRDSDGDASSQNRMEFEVWDQVKDCKRLARWFAPVYHISPAGLVLIQARTRPAKKEDMPKRVPAFFWDTKLQNWGWYDGRIVCHDYGRVSLTNGISLRKMKKAKWWGGTTKSSST